MKHTQVRASTIALAIAMSGPVFAGGYIGAGIGLASIDVCGDLIAAGATSCDDEDTGFKIFGGYDFNENIGIEGGYTDYGELTASDGITTVTAELTAFAISGKGAIPLNDNISVFGKLGVAFWDAEASASGFGSADADDTDLTYGIGAEFDVNETFGVRGEWERLDADGEDVDLLSISAILKF